MKVFTAIIKKIITKAEKTGWVHIEIPAEIMLSIQPKIKTIFRVKGKIDAIAINHVAIFPMGDGFFILPLNQSLKKQLKKPLGEAVVAQLFEDTSPIPICEDLLACLEDEPIAQHFFNSLSRSHRNYFSKWIESAKTQQTRDKRLLRSIQLLAQKRDFTTKAD